MLTQLLRRQRLEQPGLRGTIAARRLDRLGQHPGGLLVLAGAIQGDAVGVQGPGVALVRHGLACVLLPLPGVRLGQLSC